MEMALKDYEETTAALRGMKLRKATRESDVPAEICRLLICGGMVEVGRTGEKVEKKRADSVQYELASILTHTRLQGAVPCLVSV